MSSAPAGAAFFRLETALTNEPAWRHARALAAQAPSIRARLGGLGTGTLAGVLGLHPALGGPAAAARAGWAQLRGFSRDRVEVLAADYARDHLVPRVGSHARRLLEEARARGLRPALVAETVRAVAVPLAAALGIDPDAVLASDLVYTGRAEATGQLDADAVGPELGPERLRAFAASLGVDPARSAAYGASAADAILLSHVGLPCALDPDAELARIARSLGWPIVRGALAPLEVQA